MNIEEYISSGVLESYVLNELTIQQRVEVEQYALQYPEIQKELSKIELTLEKLAFSTAINPKADIKSKIMEGISGEKQNDTPIISISQSDNRLKYLVAASISIAFISTFLAFNYYGKWQNTATELSNLIAQNEQVAKDYNVVNQRLEKIEEEFKIINNVAYTRVALKGTENAPDAFAQIYWNSDSQDVYLSIKNLKALSETQQYQLWAIIDGKPVDAGVFDLQNSLIKMKNIANAAAFAITIEPKGGSVNPSLASMQVIGNV